VWHFPIFIAVSFVAFIGVLYVVLRRRSQSPETPTIIWVSAIVVIGGMTFAKVGTRMGLPVWLYYGVPAVLTWALPPLVFRMRRDEVARYLPLAIAVAPIIHVLFPSCSDGKSPDPPDLPDPPDPFVFSCLLTGHP
jgi:hypothetical protein